MVAEGDRVAFRGAVHAFPAAEFMGIPANGKQISVPVIDTTQLTRGKMPRTEFPDRMGWMQQIGVIPSPKQSAT